MLLASRIKEDIFQEVGDLLSEIFGDARDPVPKISINN
jgi:hypothetical protein